MKYSVATLSALVAVVLAKPEFLNSSFHVVEGQPFTLQFAGCEAGCTITLQSGPKENLKDVRVLSASATGASLTVTLEDLPSDTYNFKITDKSGQSNYSAQFTFQGTGTITTTTGTATGTTTATTTGATTLTKVTSTTATSTTETSTSTSTSTTSTKTSTTSKATTTSAPTTTTSEASTTTEESATTTTTRAAVTTTPPGSSAGRLSSPIALVAGVVMAIAYLS